MPTAAPDAPGPAAAASPRKVLPAPWMSSTAAAAELGLSPWTLRRRAHAAEHWVEGKHYRWIQKQQKRLLQVNLEAVRQLMTEVGW